MADWQPREIQLATPPGEAYSATLIDTWEMIETPIAASVTRGDMLYVPVKPRQALLLRWIGGPTGCRPA